MEPALLVGPNTGGDEEWLRIFTDSACWVSWTRFIWAIPTPRWRAATTISTASATRRSTCSRISGTSTAKDWVADAIRIQQKRYSDRKYEMKLIAVEGDNVATMQYLSLRKRSDDRVVHVETAEFFTMRNGLILVHRSFFDSFDSGPAIARQGPDRDLRHRRAPRHAAMSRSDPVNFFRNANFFGGALNLAARCRD